MQTLDALLTHPNPYVRLAGHQIGMYLAHKELDHGGIVAWRSHNREAAALRELWGPTYQPYPFPNKALVKALYSSLREHLITRAEFVACLSNVLGR